MSNEIMKMIGLEHLTPSSTNPRKTFDQKQLDELTESIKEKGVVQPILCRVSLIRNGEQKYEIVTGERRYRAAKAAGEVMIPAMIKALSDQDALEIQVIENLHRANVHPLEEAEGYAVLMRRPGTTAASIATKIGQSEKYVYDRIKLLSLIPKAREYFVAGKFMAGHAIILARLSADQQKQCLDPQYGGMFDWEHAGHLFDDKSEKGDPVKSKSVRELQVWVDKHVRFETDKVDQMIFPETAEVLAEVKEKAEKIVSITEDFYVQTSARNDERIIGPRSWVRADGKAGSKTCEHSATGVFVVGPGRGSSIKVCVAKEKCKTHWGSWQKERVARAKGDSTGVSKAKEQQDREEEKRKIKEEKELLWRKRYEQARPEICKQLGVLIAGAPAASMIELLADIIFDEIGVSPKTKYLMARGKTAEDFLRYCAHAVLVDKSEGYWDMDEFTKTSKMLGLDVNKMVNELVPEDSVGKKKAVNKK